MEKLRKESGMVLSTARGILPLLRRRSLMGRTHFKKFLMIISQPLPPSWNCWSAILPFPRHSFSNLNSFGNTPFHYQSLHNLAKSKPSTPIHYVYPVLESKIISFKPYYISQTFKLQLQLTPTFVLRGIIPGDRTKENWSLVRSLFYLIALYPNPFGGFLCFRPWIKQIYSKG